ncbi:MAG TPA: prepilin-type N-terminal cleavage/methylation domain-containing protein [Dissulfurispiraceae bacterium]|nr:prepilin-type N-terminal cleavage/methylation domain-containing protein [Dissulfurispiraceae bacterium]
MNTRNISLKGEHGFTLIELMISITLIVVILLIVGAAMRLGFRSVDSGERRITSLERFRSSLNIIEAQIQSELSIQRQDAAGNSTSFQGNGGSMQFPSNFSLWGNQRGYVTVSYKVRPDEWGKQDLYAEESSVGVKDRGEVKLFEFFDRIYFDYFHKDPAEEKGSWAEEWTYDTSVPEKIRLHLVNGDREMSFIFPVKVRDIIIRPPAFKGPNQQ